MKKLIISLGLILSIVAQAADVKISSLPLGSAATTGISDSFPYVQASVNITKRLTLWDLVNLPPMATTFAVLNSSPTFTGTVTAPTFVGAFSGTVTNATHAATVQTAGNASFFPLFVASSTNGNQVFNLGTGLSFNPSTSTLSTTSFVGALTGNATGLSTTLAVGSGGTGLTGGATGQLLRFSGASTIAATTATYPATTTANQLLYSSATSVIGGLTSANTGVLVTDSSGVPSIQACTTANRVLRTNGTALTCSQVAAATDISGTLAAGQFPALTGDVTTSAGSLVTSYAATANSTLASLDKSTGVTIHGTNTNNSASAGYVGEYMESKNASATNYPSSTAFGDATSLSLTAGDWDVTLLTATIPSAAATNIYVCAGISTTSGNSSTGLLNGDNFACANGQVITNSNEVGVAIPAYRVLISSTTTYYAKIVGSYTGGAPQYYYRMSARRVR